MTFKKIVKRIRDIKTEEEFNIVTAEIDKAFEYEYINFNDHELLYDLACGYYKGIKDGSYIRLI